MSSLLWLFLFFLDQGADVNAIDEYAETPLHYASYNGHLNIVELLVSHGADVNITDYNDGNTPLHIALQKCHKVIVENRSMKILNKAVSSILYNLQ